MAGSLVFGRSFKVDQSTWSDGSTHHEILPDDDGGYDVISNTTWSDEVLMPLVTAGVPADAIPTFDERYDLDLKLIVELNDRLRHNLASVDPALLPATPGYALDRVLSLVRSGLSFFFIRN